MADELEVLEKQQLSAQRSLNDLTDQLTLADHLVYKKYLTELQNYGMVELSSRCWTCRTLPSASSCSSCRN